MPSHTPENFAPQRILLDRGHRIIDIVYDSRRAGRGITKNLGPPHSLVAEAQTQTSHAVSTRSACDLCGGLRVCLPSKEQEAFDNSGCTGTGEPVLDFWYVPGGSMLSLATPPAVALKVKIFKGTSGISL